MNVRSDDGHGHGVDFYDHDLLEDPVPDPIPPPPTPTEAASASEVEDLSGYIKCLLEPWKSIPLLGRITEWPDTVPKEKRVCLIRCCLHQSCSIKVGRRRASNEALLEWFYAGEIAPEGADRFVRIALGEAHMAMWKDPAAK